MALKDKKLISELKIDIQNISPLHIGAQDDDICIDYEENTAYIQGTTIAGAFRSYAEQNFDTYHISSLFGDGNKMSRVFFYDTFSTLYNGMEIRPAVRINKETGTAEAGGKFDRKFVADGHNFQLKIEIYAEDKKSIEDYKNVIYKCLAGLNSGDVMLGSFKNSGAGLFKINNIEERNIDLTNKREMFEYLTDKKPFDKISNNILKKYISDNNITFILEGSLKTPLLIKAQDTMDSDRPDGENIKNKNGNYIIPGTSLKGILRSAAEKILSYHKKDEYIEKIFGTSGDKVEKNASLLRTFDIVIEESKEGTYNKIKIDKFTGGVMKGSLMDEKTVMGNVKITAKLINAEGNIEKNGAACIALVFRDIALGSLSLGSGYNVGRGRIKGNKLQVRKGKETLYEFDFKENKLSADNMQEYFEALNEGGR